MEKIIQNHYPSGYILESDRLNFRKITQKDFASLKEIV